MIEAQFTDLGVEPPMTSAALAALVIALDEGLAIQRGLEPRAIRPDLFIDMIRTLTDAATALDH